MFVPPFIRFALFLILGIILARLTPIDLDMQFWGYLCSSIFVLLLCFFLLQKGRKSKSYLLLGGLTLLGFSIYEFHQEINYANHLFHEENQIRSYTAKIEGFQKENEKFKIYNANVLAFQDDKKPLKVSRGKVQIYFYKTDSLTEQISIGDVLYFKGSPQKILGQNTYENYLRNQQIYLQDFITEKSWAFLQKNTVHTWSFILSNLRSNLELQLRKVFKNPNKQELAIALLLGNKTGLDTDIKDSFIKSGLAHILAVSGLHVSLILFFFLWIFQSWERANTGIRFLCFTSLMCILWGYASITAFSPSVVRASFMLSIWLLGKALQKPSDGFNTVGISAFFQLCLQPHLLFDVGFQLSYAAVLGILYFYPKWNKSFHFSFPPLEKLWQASLISLAAQLGTLPLCLFYFHQFPSYFLLSNIAITFLIPLILAFGFTTLILSFISEEIASYTALAFEFSTDLMLSVATFFSNLPFSSISPIYLEIYEVIILYLLIIAVYIAFQKQSFFSFKVGSIAGIILFSSFSFKKIHQKKNEFCELRYAQKSLMIAIKEDNTSPIIYKTNTEQASKNIAFHFSDLFEAQLGEIHIQETDTTLAFYLWDFYGQKIMYPQTTYFFPQYCIDYLILTDQHIFSEKKIMKAYTESKSLPIRKVVYFGFKNWNYEKWKRYFKSYEIDVIQPHQKNIFQIH